MTQREIDRRFRQFRRTGDPEALGRVFDAVAPKLLVVAVHLVRDGAAAEDLVQTTFLAAIEKVETFDPKRPVLPWLLGILTNEARMLRRRTGRVVDPARHRSPRPVADPADLAASAEFGETLARALDALPEHYQQVLNLRLVHGLVPQQIAHSLGCPPATIKSRLRRGLDVLRAALPAGFALSAAAVLTPTRGMAALRQTVVEAARLRLPSPTAPPSGAVSPARSPASIAKVIALVFVAVGAVVGMFSLRPWATDAPLASMLDGGLSIDAFPSGRGARVVRPARARRQSALDVGASVVSTRREVLIEGRCVDPSGAPIVGCEIVMDGLWRSWSRDWFKTPIPWVRPSRQRTDADGRFRFEFEPPEPFLLQLKILPKRHVAAICLWTHLDAGGSEDLGDIVLPALRAVRGRVVDEQGRAVAGVLVDVASWTFPAVRGGSGALHKLRPQQVRSRADGTFGPAFLVLAGDATLRVSDEVELVSSGRIAADVSERVLVVRRRATISGRVISASGLPLPGVGVVARGRLAVGHATSESDGTFVLHADRRADRDAPVSVSTDGTGSVPVSSAVASRWGANNVVLSREPLAKTRVTVRDAVTHRPVQFFAILCRPLESRFAGIDLDWIRHVCIDPKGVVEVDRVYPGRNELIVFPSSPKLAPCRPIVFSAGTALVEVELTRRESILVEVRDLHGVPVRSARVRLLRTAGSRDRLDLHHYAFWRLAPEYRASDVEPVPDLVSQARTDGSGRARLGLPRSSQFRLAVIGDAGVALVERVVRHARPGKVVRLQVPSSASIHGVARLVGRPLPPTCRVRARVLVGHRFVRTEPVSVGVGGRFEVAGIPATRRVLLELELPGPHGFLRLVSPAHIDLRNGDVERTFRFALRRARVEVRLPGAKSLVGRKLRVFSVEERATLLARVAREPDAIVLDPLPQCRFRIDVDDAGAWTPVSPVLDGRRIHGAGTTERR